MTSYSNSTVRRCVQILEITMVIVKYMLSQECNIRVIDSCKAEGFPHFEAYYNSHVNDPVSKLRMSPSLLHYPRHDVGLHAVCFTFLQCLQPFFSGCLYLLTLCAMSVAYFSWITKTSGRLYWQRPLSLCILHTVLSSEYVADSDQATSYHLCRFRRSGSYSIHLCFSHVAKHKTSVMYSHLQMPP